MESAVELHLRDLIFRQLAEIVAERGVVSRTELESLKVGNETRRVIDRNRGIWNPKDLLATVSVISNPQGRYADAHVGESLFAYDYRAGSTDGDNRKMRRAFELQLPIILLRTIRAGIFVPVFPVYVVADDLANRRFVLALDESLRFVGDPLHLEPIERAYAERAIKLRDRPPNHSQHRSMPRASAGRQQLGRPFPARKQRRANEAAQLVHRLARSGVRAALCAGLHPSPYWRTLRQYSG